MIVNGAREWQFWHFQLQDGTYFIHFWNATPLNQLVVANSIVAKYYYLHRYSIQKIKYPCCNRWIASSYWWYENKTAWDILHSPRNQFFLGWRQMTKRNMSLFTLRHKSMHFINAIILRRVGKKIISIILLALFGNYITVQAMLTQQIICIPFLGPMCVLI